MSASVATSTAIETARSFFEAYNAHKVNRMVAECADDAKLRYVPRGEQGQGKVREAGQNSAFCHIASFSYQTGP